MRDALAPTRRPSSHPARAPALEAGVWDSQTEPPAPSWPAWSSGTPTIADVPVAEPGHREPFPARFSAPLLCPVSGLLQPLTKAGPPVSLRLQALSHLLTILSPSRLLFSGPSLLGSPSRCLPSIPHTSKPIPLCFEKFKCKKIIIYKNSFKLLTGYLRGKDMKGGQDCWGSTPVQATLLELCNMATVGRRVSPFSVFLSIVRFFFNSRVI